VELDTYVLLKAHVFSGKTTTVLHDVCGTERNASVAGKEQKSNSRLTEGSFHNEPSVLTIFSYSCEKKQGV